MCNRLPLGCRNTPRSRSLPLAGGSKPVSSVNSRRAQTRGSSSASTKPLGTDQAPSSFFAQKGPPGCTRSTSRRTSRLRWSSRPALVTGKHASGGGDARSRDPFAHELLENGERHAAVLEDHGVKILEIELRSERRSGLRA